MVSIAAHMWPEHQWVTVTQSEWSWTPDYLLDSFITEKDHQQLTNLDDKLQTRDMWEFL